MKTLLLLCRVAWICIQDAFHQAPFGFGPVFYFRPFRPSLVGLLLVCLVCGEQTYHISFCHLSPSTLLEGLGAGQCFWSIRLWKPWIILSSWMKARLFHSAKKALKNEHKWKRIYSVAQRGEHILTEFIFSLRSVCDFIAWARGRSGAVSCSKDNRASYSKHKHVLRMKDAFLKRETRPRS